MLKIVLIISTITYSTMFILSELDNNVLTYENKKLKEQNEWLQVRTYNYFDYTIEQGKIIDKFHSSRNYAAKDSLLLYLNIKLN